MPDSSYLDTQNKSALDDFVQLPVSQEMILYLARKASQVILCGSSTQTLPPTPPTTPSLQDPALPSIECFITSLCKKSKVQVSTLMTSIVYLDRLKSRLHPDARGIHSTIHRIFLAALILAAKNLNDSSPKNKDWAQYTEFSIAEVNLMERQLLLLLDWDVRISPQDLYYHLEPFLAPIRVHHSLQYELTVQRSANNSHANRRPSSRSLVRRPFLPPPTPRVCLFIPPNPLRSQRSTYKIFLPRTDPCLKALRQRTKKRIREQGSLLD